VLGGQLVDREAQPRMRRAGIIARHFAFGMQGVDPQADVKCSPRARAGNDGAAALDLLGRIEDHMVRKPQDFVEILGLVGRAIGRDLAIIEFGREPRFPQAGCADAIEVFAR
jgi:hypothetical protein